MPCRLAPCGLGDPGGGSRMVLLLLHSPSGMAWWVVFFPLFLLFGVPAPFSAVLLWLWFGHLVWRSAFDSTLSSPCFLPRHLALYRFWHFVSCLNVCSVLKNRASKLNRPHSRMKKAVSKVDANTCSYYQ